MPHPPKYRITKQQLLDQFINFFWTTLCFGPILWFWLSNGIDIWFYLFLGICLATGILPERALKRLKLSKGKKVYEYLGVKIIRKFVQNGDWSRRIMTRGKSSISISKLQVAQHLKNIAMYERFHWSCLVFFLLTSIYGFAVNNTVAALWILVANLLYNVWAILLQQYNKIRIQKISSDRNRPLNIRSSY